MVKKYICTGIVLGTFILSACGDEKVPKETVKAEIAEVLPNGEMLEWLG